MTEQGSVEIWWARLADAREDLAADLDPVEAGRLCAYRRQADRDRFLLGVTITRRVLAATFSVRPAAVELDRSCPTCGRPHGKVRSAAGIRLSVSHSGELVGVAFHPSAEVGLDVEQVDPGLDVDALARMTLSAAETLPDNDRSLAFTRYWVRKEAVLKATGAGLSRDLRSITVTAPDQPPAVTGEEQPAGIQLVDLQVDDGYLAALAVLSDRQVDVVQRNAEKLLRS